MRPNSNLAAISLALLLAFASGAAAADAIKPAASLDENADQILRRMSSKLAGSKSFRFEATRDIDPALLEGREMPEKSRITVEVQRPDKLSAKAVSNTGTRRFIADGSTLTLVDEKKNHYATVPMRTSLDGMVERLDAKYGFTPPLAEFALSNPYADLRSQAHSVTYLGKAKTAGGFFGAGGTECHRIGLKGKVANAELWIAVSDQLPRKLVATFHGSGNPQMRVAFSSWTLAAPAGDFTFTPAAGAQKIEAWTTERMAVARKSTAAKQN